MYAFTAAELRGGRRLPLTTPSLEPDYIHGTYTAPVLSLRVGDSVVELKLPLQRVAGYFEYDEKATFMDVHWPAMLVWSNESAEGSDVTMLTFHPGHIHVREFGYLRPVLRVPLGTQPLRDGILFFYKSPVPGTVPHPGGYHDRELRVESERVVGWKRPRFANSSKPKR